MSKFIDADRLRAEINRRIKSHKELSEKPEMSDLKLELQMVDNSLQGIISFINSLQQEQPEVDLEKEIKDICRGYRINESHEQELGKQDIENIVRYSFNLGFNARK